jgi:aminocarboxymuconate-semialdehyde decarboxylase
MAGIATARTIDIHAHAVLEETMGAAGRFGPELGADAEGKPWFRVGDYRLLGVKYRGSPFMEPDLRIKRMDAAGIDFQVLSPNPLTYFHFIDAKEAIAFCRRHNDALAALVRRYPQRLGGLAALPIQEPAASVDELERGVTELGLWGAYIGTSSPRPVESADFDPLYEKFIALDVPLFLHPAPAGIDGPAGDRNLKGFDLDLVIGFAAQETIAVARLIFGGVLERHPKLDICISHGGGTVAFMAGRLAQAGRMRPWAPAWTKPDGAFEQTLRRLWYDAHVHDPRALEMLIGVVGKDRMVFGTNFAGWDQPENVAHVPHAAELADNARRLLRRTARGAPGR